MSTGCPNAPLSRSCLSLEYFGGAKHNSSAHISVPSPMQAAEHPVGLSQIQAHRLSQHDMLAGGGSNSHLAVDVVRSTDYD